MNLLFRDISLRIVFALFLWTTVTSVHADEVIKSFIAQELSNVKLETGFQRKMQIGFVEVFQGLNLDWVDQERAIRHRDLASLAAEDSVFMGELGYLLGFMLNPILWLVAIALGFLTRNMQTLWLRMCVIGFTVLGVSAALTPDFPGIPADRINVTKIIGGQIYGWLMVMLIKPKIDVTSTEQSEELLPYADFSSTHETLNMDMSYQKDFDGQDDLTEHFLEQIVEDYRQGNVREGIWAKALIAVDGDETKAYPKYLELTLQAMLREEENKKLLVDHNLGLAKAISKQKQMNSLEFLAHSGMVYSETSDSIHTFLIGRREIALTQDEAERLANLAKVFNSKGNRFLVIGDSWTCETPSTGRTSFTSFGELMRYLAKQ